MQGVPIERELCKLHQAAVELKFDRPRKDTALTVTELTPNTKGTALPLFQFPLATVLTTR